MTTEPEYLTGRLLMAMPGMFDKRFERTVNVICSHDANGAMGINIGHFRKDLRLRMLLEKSGFESGETPDCGILHGGPVEPARGFVLHSPDWSGLDTIQVGSLCALSGSTDVVRAIASGKGPEQWLFALGYAGWGPGQLDNEMRHHGWYAAQGRQDILFETPAGDRWNAAWKAEGIDPALLSHVIGQA